VLSDRLNETDSQLAEKTNYNEVRLKEKKITPEDLSKETIELITGEGVVEILSVPQDDSVSAKKTIKGIRDKLRPSNMAFPLKYLDKESDNYTKPIEVDVYKKVNYDIDKIEFKDGGVLSKSNSGTTIGTEYYVTEEMKKWGKISFAITANEDKGLYRAYFYKENGDIIKIEVADYVNGKFLKEGADMPPDTHTIDIVVGGDSSGNFFTNPILTLGDVIGDYNEAYADNLLHDKTIDDFIKKNNDISRVTVKKEHALKSGSNNIHFMIPSNLMIAIVQYDLNGKSIYNSGFIGSLYIEKIKGYFDTGKIEIISGAYETFAILA